MKIEIRKEQIPRLCTDTSPNKFKVFLEAFGDENEIDDLLKKISKIFENKN